MWVTGTFTLSMTAGSQSLWRDKTKTTWCLSHCTQELLTNKKKTLMLLTNNNNRIVAINNSSNSEIGTGREIRRGKEMNRISIRASIWTPVSIMDFWVTEQLEVQSMVERQVQPKTLTTCTIRKYSCTTPTPKIQWVMEEDSQTLIIAVSSIRQLLISNKITSRSISSSRVKSSPVT